MGNSKKNEITFSFERDQEHDRALIAELRAERANTITIAHNFKKDHAATVAGREAARARARSNGKP